MEAIETLKSWTAALGLEWWPTLIVLAWASIVKRLSDAVKLDRWVEAWAAYVTEDFDDVLKDVFWGVLTVIWAGATAWLTGAHGFKGVCVGALTYGIGSILIYEGLCYVGIAEKIGLRKKS